MYVAILNAVKPHYSLLVSSSTCASYSSVAVIKCHGQRIIYRTDYFCLWFQGDKSKPWQEGVIASSRDGNRDGIAMRFHLQPQT